jgi:hypothetical protein
VSGNGDREQRTENREQFDKNINYAYL